MARASLPAKLAAATVIVAGSAAAQNDATDVEGAFDRTPQECLIISQIDQTDAVDDQNLIFRMRNDKVYRNHLPRKCPGLERENRFVYESHNSRLCSIDTITVLEQRLGGGSSTGLPGGFQGGFTCRLGEFIPLSPAEIEDLDARRREGRRGRSGISARPVETDADDADETAAEEASPADAAAPPVEAEETAPQ